MSLSSLHLDAFIAAARLKSFSLAAKNLHITQSALSQRIRNLEEELGVNVFIRHASGVELSTEGEKLLAYAANKSEMETELLESFHPRNKCLSGTVRIACFSTFLRSILLPKLGEIKKNQALIHTDIVVAEVYELANLLRSGRVHFLFTTIPMESEDIETHCIGIERNVLIQGHVSSDLYLDHDERDTTTFDFFKIQTVVPASIKRAYFSEIYTIIDAAAEGLGRAVVPLHLIKDNKRVRIVEGFQSLDIPIYFAYFKQYHRTRLHHYLIEEFKSFTHLSMLF